MLGFIHQIQKDKIQRKILLAFYDEVYSNWESYHVMYQRGYFFPFRVKVLEKIKESSDISLDWEKWSVYIDVVKTFNKSFEDFAEFERWYASDMKNKSQENAKILHAKKETVSENFKDLEPILASAKEHLLAYLKTRKILK